MTTTINVKGTYYVGENETENNVVINLGSPAGHLYGVSIDSHHTAGGTLTIGDAATVNSNAQVMVDLNGYTIVNRGQISPIVSKPLWGV